MDRRLLLVGLPLLLILVVAAVLLVRARSSRGPQPIADTTPGPSEVVASPTAPPAPPPRLAYTPVPADNVAPVVVQRVPERGTELAPDGAVELVFDRAMDQRTVAQAFSLSAGGASVAGNLEWPDARTLRFMPANALERAALYDVVLGQEARATDGAQLNGAYQFRFATRGFLEVAQVIPAPGTQDALAASAITVIFNRPVVALSSSTNFASLPQPLTLEPAVEGTGEWLSTAVYVFRPAQALRGGTTYTGRIAPGLLDTDGNPLAQEFRWQFGVAAPQVLSVSPPDGQDHVSVEPSLLLQLNQPVDLAAAQASFRLSGPDGAVAGNLRVEDDYLFFTPTERLAFDAEYSARLDGGALLAQPFQWRFRTVPLPRLLSTDPPDGATAASPYTELTLQFNTFIDPATVLDHLTMNPPLSPTQVYSYFNDYDYTFRLSFGAQPSTDYEVQVSPGIADRWGNQTAEALTVRFRTGPLPPSVQLVTPDYVGTYSALEPARVVLSTVNASSLDMALYRFSPPKLLGYYGWDDTPPDPADLLRRWTVSLNTPLNATTRTRIELAEDQRPLEPGVYLLIVDPPGDQWDMRHVLVVTEYNLALKAGAREALVWATRLSDGQPAPGVALTFYDDQAGQLGSATTDDRGLARVSFEGRERRRIYALTDCAATPCPGFAAVVDGWSNGIYPGDFGIGQAWNYPDLNAFVYTDRPLYRPGQRVAFRGILRRERDVRYSLPENKTVKLRVQNPDGEQLFEKELALSALGTFADGLDLAEGAALGQYTIVVEVDQFNTFSYPFTVAAYRAPELEVGVNLPNAEAVRGSPTRAEVQVSYFFGGPVANTPVAWNVLAESYRFEPPGLGRYRFDDVEDPWIGPFSWWWMPPPPPQPILSGSGTTDASGKLTIDLPAELKNLDGSPITGSLKLIVEATVSGKDNQAISGRGTLTTHRAPLYLGLAPRSYVASAGQEQEIDLVAVDIQGQRQPGKQVSVEVERVTWENRFIAEGDDGAGRWESSEQRTSVAQQTVTTDARGEAIVRFTPADGGSYRVIARLREGQAEARSSMFVWVTGSEYIPWRRDNSDRINLIADRTRYQPGETAEILIPSPYRGPVWALISVERGDIITYEVLQLQSNSTVYRLPIKAGHAPNIFVSALLISVEAAQEGGGTRYDQKLGYLPLEIEPVAQTLSVTLTPDRPQAGPGETVTYQVRATDAAGAPVAAELSLDLVDKAVLSLMPREPNALREHLYGRRDLGISTSSGLSVSGNRLLALLERQLQEKLGRGGGAPTGSAADSAELAGAPMPQATAAPAAAEAAPMLAAPAQNTGSALPPGVTVRSEFADTAFWQPSLTTDANGQGSVEVKLPDNLTTWVMRGVGLTADTEVGEGTVDLVATKPLLIRPVAPRFLVLGDSAELAANVSNNTDGSLSVRVGLDASGVRLDSPQLVTVTIPARAEATVRWMIAVDEQALGNEQPADSAQQLYADLVFSAVAGEYSDAARPRLATGPEGKLPIYRFSVPEAVGTAGLLGEAGSRTEVVALPPGLDLSRGELTLRLEPSLAAGMREGLDYLEHFEYECTEQTVSRFLPNVVTYAALKTLGLNDAELEQKLPALVREGSEKLALRQNADGGWGWWPERESNPHVSAYALLGLLEAREAGFDVEAAMLTRGQDYLKRQLAPIGVASTGAEANLQAFLLYVLGEAGQSQRQNLDGLLDYREKLGVYGKALLALALEKNRSGDPAIKTLLADLNTQAIMSATGAHWEEAERDYWAMSSDTRSTAIALMALTRLDPENQLTPNVVRWLMVARRGSIWETTQESAWSIMALTAWMARTGELEGSYDYAAWLNDRERASGVVNAENIDQPAVTRIAVAELLKDASNRLTVGRGPGAGVLYYSAHLNAYLPVEEVRALDRGIIVRRRYTLASCSNGPQCPQVSQVKLGDVVRVEITLTAPRDLYYLRLEDPLPAGAEAVDTGLATTSLLAEAPGISGEAGPGFERGPWDWWWNWYSRSELRDEKVVLFADYLARGSYQYSYTMRATLPGSFRVIPTTASEFYFPEVYGRGDGQVLEVK